MKFIVAQIGARRSYAVPDLLEKARLLERFYTNVSGNLGIGSFALALARPFFPDPAERLAGRRIPNTIRGKTTTFTLPAVKLGLSRIRGQHDPPATFAASAKYSEALGRAMSRRGFGQATHIYSMLGECGPFLAKARQRGLKVVSEVYILLSTERIMREERKRFPDWEPDVPDFTELRNQLGIEDYLMTYSDYFICPSEAVKRDLVQNFNVTAEKTAVVPYGVSDSWFEVRNKPIPGRILFAGTADLRKGIHYLASAATKLQAKHSNYEFRIVGNVRQAVRQQSQCRSLTFVGRLPREQLKDELRSADAFVLPSLAEGSAEVTYEALAAGLPVVTTAASGSIVRDGIEGRIVPERDSDSIATAIEQIVGDRDRRACMAEAAQERARDFSWEKYGQRLISILERFE